jgi:hypothetical protein
MRVNRQRLSATIERAADRARRREQNADGQRPIARISAANMGYRKCF